MSDEEFKVSEKDLAVFPPHLLFFAIATMCMLVSHGLAAIIVFFSYLSIPLELAFAFLFLSGLPFVVFNLAVIKGHKYGVSGLKLLAIFYFTVALSCFVIPEKTESDIGAAVVLLLSSFCAWLTVTSTRYKIMSDFLIRRWGFYRETGRTVIEEMELQRKKKRKR